MATTPQLRTTQHSDASTFLPPIPFLPIFYTFLQKQFKRPKLTLFVVQFQRRKPDSKLLHMTIKRPTRAKRFRRPTKSSDLLDFEEAARLRQQPQLLGVFSQRPEFELLPQQPPIEACPLSVSFNLR